MISLTDKPHQSSVFVEFLYVSSDFSVHADMVLPEAIYNRLNYLAF